METEGIRSIIAFFSLIPIAALMPLGDRLARWTVKKIPNDNLRYYTYAIFMIVLVLGSGLLILWGLWAIFGVFPSNLFRPD